MKGTAALDPELLRNLLTPRNKLCQPNPEIKVAEIQHDLDCTRQAVEAGEPFRAPSDIFFKCTRLQSTGQGNELFLAFLQLPPLYFLSAPLASLHSLVPVQGTNLLIYRASKLSIPLCTLQCRCRAKWSPVKIAKRATHQTARQPRPACNLVTGARHRARRPPRRRRRNGRAAAARRLGLETLGGLAGDRLLLLAGALLRLGAHDAAAPLLEVVVAVVEVALDRLHQLGVGALVLRFARSVTTSAAPLTSLHRQLAEILANMVCVSGR